MIAFESRRAADLLIDSYHCSRYNQNTRRLDAAMFEAVFERAIALKRPREPPVKLRPAVAEEAEGGAVLLRRGEVERRDQHAGLLAPNSARMSPRSSQMKLWP
jgi:hypothetical protein